MASEPRTNAQDLQTRLHFDKHATASDDYGNVTGDFFNQFSRWAWVRPRLGGEQVFAARLEGRSPVSITVRSDSSTRTITQDWRARDDDGVVYNLKSVVQTPAREWIEMLAEIGGNVA